MTAESETFEEFASRHGSTILPRVTDVRALLRDNGWELMQDGNGATAHGFTEFWGWEGIYYLAISLDEEGRALSRVAIHQRERQVVAEGELKSFGALTDLLHNPMATVRSDEIWKEVPQEISVPVRVDSEGKRIESLALTPAQDVAAPDATEPTDANVVEEPALVNVSDPEYVAVGMIIHTPAILGDLQTFLSARDFANPQLRAIYQTVHELWKRGELADLNSLPDEAARLGALAANARAVINAVADQRFVDIAIPKLDQLVTECLHRVPKEVLPYKGLHNPSAQVRIGQQLLRESLDRNLLSLGAVMTPATRWFWSKPPDAEEMARRFTRALDRLNEREARLDQAVSLTGESEGEQDLSGIVKKAREAVGPSRLQKSTAAEVLRAERHLLHAVIYEDITLDPPLVPEDFTDPACANTWRVIVALQERNAPVNHFAVMYEIRDATDLPAPVLSMEELTRMGSTKPVLDSARITRSLRTVLDASLDRFSRQTGAALEALANVKGADPQKVLAAAKEQVNGLAIRARTAAAHQNSNTYKNGAGR